MLAIVSFLVSLLGVAVGAWIVNRAMRRAAEEVEPRCAVCGTAGERLTSFQCPGCGQFASFTAPLIKERLVETGKVRFVYYDFPLPQHPNAAITAQASEAAALQGKFWPMHDLLFANHTEWTELADPTDVLVGYAQRIGLNIQKFKADLTSQAVKDIVDTHLKEARRISLFQTPTFFINGKMIQNPQSYEQFNSILQAAAR